MKEIFERRRQKVLDEVRSDGIITGSVEDIPTYRVRTPLQSAIMILKRHRDIMFADDPKNKPISIIISTLAAHAYRGEETIGLALLSILSRMQDAIDHDGKKYIIRNPTDALENFADKWESHPERAEAFFDWLKEARENFREAGRLVEHRRISSVLASRVGRDLTDQVSTSINSSSSVGGGLLSAATAASALSASNVSFSDEPRTPKKPDGFA